MVSQEEQWDRLFYILIPHMYPIYIPHICPITLRQYPGYIELVDRAQHLHLGSHPDFCFFVTGQSYILFGWPLWVKGLLCEVLCNFLLFSEVPSPGQSCHFLFMDIHNSVVPGDFDRT